MTDIASTPARGSLSRVFHYIHASLPILCGDPSLTPQPLIFSCLMSSLPHMCLIFLFVGMLPANSEPHVPGPVSPEIPPRNPAAPACCLVTRALSMHPSNPGSCPCPGLAFSAKHLTLPLHRALGGHPIPANCSSTDIFQSGGLTHPSPFLPSRLNTGPTFKISFAVQHCRSPPNQLFKGVLGEKHAS